jgi:hypothetical protein
MVGVMNVYATKGTRVVGFDSIPALGVCFCCPLGGFGSLGSGCPQGVGVVGDDFRLDQDCCYSYSFLSSCYCLLDGVGWQYLIVQNFDTVGQRKVEQSSPPHLDVGEP